MKYEIIEDNEQGFTFREVILDMEEEYKKDILGVKTGKNVSIIIQKYSKIYAKELIKKHLLSEK